MRKEVDIFSFYSLIGNKGKKLLKGHIFSIAKRSVTLILWPCYYILFLYTRRISKKSNHDCNVLLIGDLHYEDVKNNYDVVLLTGPGGIRRKLKWIIGDRNVLGCYDIIYPCIIFYFYIRISYVENYIVNRLANFIKCNKIDHILLGNDTKPLERLWIKASSKARVANSVYQHGIWAAANLNKHEYDGWFADQLLVYDKNHMNIVVNNGMPSSKVKVVGFPNRFQRVSKERKLVNPVVCIIGTAGYRSGFGDEVKTYFSKIATELKSLGYSVFYKPHPIELTDNNIEITCCDSFEGSVENALDEFDIFISIGSTFLIEATIAGKLSIQLAVDFVEIEDFSKLGYAKSMSLSDILCLFRNKEFINEHSSMSKGFKFVDRLPISVFYDNKI